MWARSARVVVRWRRCYAASGGATLGAGMFWATVVRGTRTLDWRRLWEGWCARVAHQCKTRDIIGMGPVSTLRDSTLYTSAIRYNYMSVLLHNVAFMYLVYTVARH